MNELDVAGILRTYAEKCALCQRTKYLKEIVRELKHELNAKEIAKMRVIKREGEK